MHHNVWSESQLTIIQAVLVEGSKIKPKAISYFIGLLLRKVHFLMGILISDSDCNCDWWGIQCATFPLSLRFFKDNARNLPQLYA